jgi:hypothetical protein
MDDQFLHENDNVAIRHGLPTKISREAYGFQWHLVSKLETTRIYIQTSKDEKNPRWIPWAKMLELVYFEKSRDPVFMEECITRYLRENKLS